MAGGIVNFREMLQVQHQTRGQKKPPSRRLSAGSFRLFYQQAAPPVQGLCRETPRHLEIFVDWMKCCRLAEAPQHDIERGVAIWLFVFFESWKPPVAGNNKTKSVKKRLRADKLGLRTALCRTVLIKLKEFGERAWSVLPDVIDPPEHHARVLTKSAIDLQSRTSLLPQGLAVFTRLVESASLPSAPLWPQVPPAAPGYEPVRPSGYRTLPG